MTPIDYVLIALLLVFVASGYVKGFFAQILQMIAIVVAFVIASRLYLPLADNEFLRGVREHNPSAAQVIAFLGLFLLAGAALGTLASLITRKFRSETLKPSDRMLGAALSTAKGILILGGLALGLQQWDLGERLGLPAEQEEATENFINQSRLIPYLSDACLSLVALIPDSQREKIQELYEDQERRLHVDPPTGTGGPAATQLQPSALVSGEKPNPGVAPTGVSPTEAVPSRSSPAVAPPVDTETGKPVVLDFASIRRLADRDLEVRANIEPASAKIEDALPAGTKTTD